MKPSSTASTEFVGVTTPPTQLAVDLLFIPVFQDTDDLTDVAGLDAATGGEVGRARGRGEFRAKLYDIFVTPATAGGWRAGRIALVGAGRLDDFTPERVRRVAAACAYFARKRRVTSIGWLMRKTTAAVHAAQCVADGLSQADFEIGSYKHDEAPGPVTAKVVIAVPGADDTRVSEAVQRGRIIGRAANFAKSLANEPGNVLTPREFAARVSGAAEAAGLAVDVLDESRIRERGMGLLLGVAQGSAEPPRVIVIRHDPPGAPAAPVMGLVGKGITFDSGGISIKPAEGMDRMKSDMSGGAAVAGAICALAELRAPCRVVAVIPATENMPGGHAIRPGDVLTGASGKTVEVINTDAEGRLILGDALWYAQELGATHLIDVATLTGACMVALGRTVAGLFGQPDAWVDTVSRAAARAGDRVWHMPIYEEATEQLRSEIADMVNSAGRMGGAVTAAAFLREFAGNRPWAHLDIAGPAWAETKEPYQPKGPTGVAVRVLIELGMTRGESGPAPKG
jgi:leucyl aminopeptidase